MLANDSIKWRKSIETMTSMEKNIYEATHLHKTFESQLVP